MAKRKNVDESKNEPEAPAKRARKPTGFRTACPRPHESQSVTAGSSSSLLTTSHIMTLVLGPNGSSYRCPTDSCRIPVIPVESGGIRRNQIWQRHQRK